jgi:hypothetical protein
VPKIGKMVFVDSMGYIEEEEDELLLFILLIATRSADKPTNI